MAKADAYQVEVFRAECDELTDQIMAVIHARCDGLPPIDRSVIISAAIANVACLSDGGADELIFRQDGVTGRLHRITNMWVSR